MSLEPGPRTHLCHGSSGKDIARKDVVKKLRRVVGHQGSGEWYRNSEEGDLESEMRMRSGFCLRAKLTRVCIAHM